MSEVEPGKLRLPAKLFSSGGKLAVLVDRLSSVDATISAEVPPAAESIAVVVRNGIRICGTVLPDAEGRFRIAFDRPIDMREHEMFAGAATPGDRAGDEPLRTLA